MRPRVIQHGFAFIALALIACGAPRPDAMKAAADAHTSSDMRDLLASEPHDVRAAEAVMLFCYQVKKWVGSFAAALGGLDTLVFAGGIGENAPAVRARICDGLAFLGIELDQARNAASETLISAAGGRVAVHVIRTDEERMIAKMVCDVLGRT